MSIQPFAIERCSDLAEPLCAQLAPVRELVASIPAPRCDHRQHQDPALAQQVLIDTRIVLADFFGAWARSNSTGPRQHVSRSMNSSPFFVVSTLPGCGSPCSNCSRRRARRSLASGFVTCRRAAPGPRRRAPECGRGLPRVVEPDSTRSVKCGVGTSSLRMPACSRSSALA